MYGFFYDIVVCFADLERDGCLHEVLQYRPCSLCHGGGGGA